jgi:hypothetical protein
MPWSKQAWCLSGAMNECERRSQPCPAAGGANTAHAPMMAHFVKEGRRLEGSLKNLLLQWLVDRPAQGDSTQSS